MIQAAGGDAGTMMAVQASRETVEEVTRGEADIFPANFNAPLQTVVSGRRASLEALGTRLSARGIESRLIPVGCGFHSPFVAEAAKAFEGALAALPHSPARFPVYSNYLAARFPEGEAEARSVLSAHLSHPVRFMEEIQGMYDDGARVFVEVGPGRVCGNLISEILRGKSHAVVSCDGAASRVGAVRFMHALAQMFAHGLDLRLDPLFNRRVMESRSVAAIPGVAREAARSKVTWMVSPEVSWPAGTPKPQITPVALPAPAASAPAPAANGTGANAPASTTPVAAAAAPPPPAATLAHGGMVKARTDDRSITRASTPDVRVSGEALDAVVLRHQNLMASFLDQQKQVMLAYLGSRQAAGAVRVAISAPPVAARIEAPRAAAPAAPSAPEIAAPVAKAAPSLVAPVAAPAAEAPSATVDLMAQLVALVAERTGYPIEALAPEQDMEGDLGIDSIKRVEILTSFARQFANLGAAVPEQLRAARTLQDVVAVMRSNLGAGDATQEKTPITPPPAAAAAAADPQPPLPPAVEITAAGEAGVGSVSKLDPEDLVQQLVVLVAERTGYPLEALTPEQDMEADLGIDSIKRVEILTSFARQFPTVGAAVPEQLRAARTLQDVVDVMRKNLGGGPVASTSVPVTQAAIPATPESGRLAPGEGVERYVLGMKESPLLPGAEVPVPGGALVITDDGRGYAAALRDRLQALGGRPVIVRLDGAESASEGIYVADLSDHAQVEALLARIRRDCGQIGAVLHLLPLRPMPSMKDLSAEEFGRVVNQEVKGLFYLLRSAAADLRAVPGSWALTCLSFGAAAANGSLPVPDHPWRGGLIGVIKTVTIEWPHVVAKSLVLEDSAIGDAVSQVLSELAGPVQAREAYYRNGARLVPEPRMAPLSAERTFVDLRSEDVVVVIGGARGITSEVAREMARQARPTLILVGRSPWPDPEKPETAGAPSDADLKRVLFAQLKAQGKAPTPMELDSEARRILREREMRAAVSDMESAGSRVVYCRADVRDGAATADLFRQIYETHGRIDGVVCGAGIIEDKLIEDKTPASFDRVFDTKAQAVFNLAQVLRPESLKFFVIFSSVAGWAGNRGQVDYVAANEVLNRMALHLSGRWNRRVVAIDWGPWEKAGMVTAETRRQFVERGVGLVAPDAGRRFLLDEIRFGDPSHFIVAALGKLAVDEPAVLPLATRAAAAVELAR
jgi:NAD(P)-dependent dehydrogenase (short-subunit alcohol dehydrogenase family)/malonyl CoA-acyl carrier protein transacylase/acyl carrier protein